MGNIHSFDKSACKVVERAMIAALIPVAAQFGLRVGARGGNYGPTEFLAKVQFVVTVTTDGTSKEEADFKRLCGMWYCKPEDYKRLLTINGQKWELIGFSPNRPKYAIVVRHAGDGRIRNFSAVVLKKNGIFAPWEKDESAMRTEAQRHPEGIFLTVEDLVKEIA